MEVGAAPLRIISSLAGAAAPGGQDTVDLHPAKYCNHLEVWAKRKQRDSWLDSGRTLL